MKIETYGKPSWAQKLSQLIKRKTGYKAHWVFCATYQKELNMRFGQ